jgi:hypothetical protein
MSYCDDREAVARRLDDLRAELERLHSTIPLDEARIVEIIEEIRDLTSETGSQFFLPSAAA